MNTDIMVPLLSWVPPDPSASRIGSRRGDV